MLQWCNIPEAFKMNLKLIETSLHFKTGSIVDASDTVRKVKTQNAAKRFIIQSSSPTRDHPRLQFD